MRSAVSPSPGGSDSAKKKKKKSSKSSGSRRGASRAKADSPLSSEGSPMSSTPSSSAAAAAASDSVSMLPAGLRVFTPLPLKDAAPNVVSVPPVAVSVPAPTVAEQRNQVANVAWPPLPDPVAPPFVYVESSEETVWKAAVDSKVQHAGGLVLGGGRRTPRSRAASLENASADAVLPRNSTKLEVVAEDPSEPRKSSSDVANGEQAATTPFKAKAELYGLVVPDRPQTPLPPPPPVDADNDDDDDVGDDDENENGERGENGDLIFFFKKKKKTNQNQNQNHSGCFGQVCASCGRCSFN